jgi:hypothetical protein
MNITYKSLFEQQLEAIVKEYATAQNKSKYDDCSDILKEKEVKGLQTKCLAAIERVVGRSSTYYDASLRILNENNHAWGHLAGIVGVVESLLSDLSNGYLRSLEELIHSDVFSDFLEMADYLTDSGYKDAGAVIAGSTLEAHLRKLADKLGVSILAEDKPKKADTINAEIVKAGGYSKLDQKNVTAWLGIRNDAAHGVYDAYDKNQVKLLISGIRDFITRNQA